MDFTLYLIARRKLLLLDRLSAGQEFRNEDDDSQNNCIADEFTAGDSGNDEADQADGQQDNGDSAKS